MKMTIIENRTMNIICSNLPRISAEVGHIASELKRIADSLETHECCICGKQFKGHGHNPHPVETEGVCCDECNTKVVMARIKQLEQMTEEE